MLPRMVAIAVVAFTVVADWSIHTAQQVRIPPTNETVDVQLLAFNDFHGQLEPPTGSNGRIGSIPAGGVEYFATHLAQLEGQNPNTLIVAAGDLIGASPLISALFHDEPTIEALNAMGLDVSSVGNHEFDDGWAELYRMQRGGCHPVDGCQDNTPFVGAAFEYLSSNVFFNSRKANKTSLAHAGANVPNAHSKTLLRDYSIKTVGGVKIGFIGMTLERTPELVSPTGVQGLSFRSEAETVNKLAPTFKKQGVRAVIVLVHQGGVPSAPDYNGCNGVIEPIEPLARRMSDDVDVIVSGHTHTAYICTFGHKLVTSAAAYGRLITKIDLTIDKVTGEVVSKTARNIVVTRDVAKSSAQTAILDHYRPFYAAVAGRLVGAIASDLTEKANAAGESSLGDVIADAFLAAAKEARGTADFALMNPGGIRADLAIDPRSNAGSVRYEQVFSVLPFQNTIVVKTLTGEMIRKVLEQQFDNPNRDEDSILQVSAGFSYAYDRLKSAGARVDPASMTVTGQTIRPKQKYRVALPDFLAAGGDNFTELRRATDPIFAGKDVDILASYLSRHAPVRPGPMNRITRVK